jgi:bacterial/archaeal transporter family protein
MSWKVFALGSAFFAGLTAVLAKIGVEEVPSNMATLIRTVVILFFLAGLVFLRGDWRNPGTLPGKSLLFLILSGLATGLSWICYYLALQAGPASLVAPIDKLSLVVAILLAVVFLGERLNVLQWTGAACVGIGTLLLVFR